VESFWKGLGVWWVFFGGFYFLWCIGLIETKDFKEVLSHGNKGS